MSSYDLRPPKANPAIELEVKHEDHDLLVLHKPAGLTMHPGTEHGKDTLLNGLVARYPELLLLGKERSWGLVQRLDKETSGILVVARTVEARDGLVAAFSSRTVEKRYRALVKGAPREERGSIDTPIEWSDASTQWALEERVGSGNWVVSNLVLRPLSGRKHQIRIHLASIGCPVLGDKKHGASSIPIAQQLGLKRMALHAEGLAFPHPITGERMSFGWRFPDDLQLIWDRAKRAAPT